MKKIKDWFGLGLYDEDRGYQEHWYNGRWEWNGSRIRFIVGDMLTEQQVENGGESPGPRLSFDLVIQESDMPEFYVPNHPDAVYDVHYLSMCVWRWGFYLCVRGRVR